MVQFLWNYIPFFVHWANDSSLPSRFSESITCCVPSAPFIQLSDSPLRRWRWFRPLKMSKDSHQSLACWILPSFLIYDHSLEEFASSYKTYLLTSTIWFFMFFFLVLSFADIFSVIMSQNGCSINLKQMEEFPGSPAVRTQRFHICGPGSVPGWGANIPQAAWPKTKTKRQMAEIEYMMDKPHPLQNTRNSG